MFPVLPASLLPDFLPFFPHVSSYPPVPTGLSYTPNPDNTSPTGNADSQELAVLFLPESDSHKTSESAENHDLSDNSDHHYGTPL